MQGGAFDRIDYRYDNANDGGLAFTLGAATSSIEYRGLEPLTNTGTAAEMTFTLGAAADNAVLEQLSPGTLRLRSADAVPTFESTTFAAPTTSLTILGGDGNDTITVTPIDGTFALSIDGEVGTDTLVVDQTDVPVAAPAFSFADFQFIQTATPDQAQALAGALGGGFGVTITSPPGATFEVSGFPDAAAGFDPALSVGRLLNPGLTTGTIGVNLPSSNLGTVVRSGIVVSWSGGRTLSEQAGDDFVIYESSSNPNGPDAAMVQVRDAATGVWSKWRYETPDTRAPYGGAGTEGTFATAFDLADFGFTAGQAIDAIRYVNMTAADRMEGPGMERVAGSGVLVASGFVVPGDNGATSTVLPDPGATASFAYYGNATFDPDPLYFGVLHPLDTAGGADTADVVNVTTTTIAVSRNGTARPTIDYASFDALEINTHGGADAVSIDVAAGLPANIRVDAGDPTSQDSLTVRGTTGAQSFTLTADTITDGAATIEVAGVETVEFDLTTTGAGDTVSVDRSFVLSGNAPVLRVVGGGAGDNDQLHVDTEFPAAAPAAAESFTFAGVSFDESSTPDQFSELGLGAIEGGKGAVITTRPLNTGPASGTITGFPDSQVGFDASLSLGALWARTTSATPRFVSLPDETNNGNTARAGFVLGWSDGRTVADGAGTDFVVYESGFDGGADAFMVQVRDADTGVWSDWVYKKAGSSANYGGAAAFATQFDLATDFGLTGAIDSIRLANLTVADRVDDVSGEGRVVIGGGTGTFQPLDNTNTPFGADGFDPDPLYFGVRQPLSATATPRSDSVNVDADSVDVVGFIGIQYAGLQALSVDTGGGADSITATPSAETTYTLRGESPSIDVNPGDRLVLHLAGVVDPTFTATGIGAGTLASVNRANVFVEGIDSLGATSPTDIVVSEAANPAAGTVDTFHVVRNGASDEVSVNGQLVLRVDREAVDNLLVQGTDAADDELTIDYSGGIPIPAGDITFAAGVGGADLLRYVGATVTTVTQTYDDSDTGNTAIDGVVLAYDEVENITDDLVAANRDFVYLATDNTIDLGDDLSQAGRSQITSDHGATTRFNNPTATMSLDAGPGNDVVTLAELDAAYAASLTIRGGTGDDDIALDTNGRATPGGTVDWIQFPLAIDGGGQTDDRLTIDDTGSTRDKTYTVSNVRIGGAGVPAGAAVAVPGVVPNVNGVIDGAEWDQVPVAFDSGPRPASDQQSILHFDFAVDGGNTTADTTGNNNTGLLVTPPGPQFRVSQGRFGGALEFDGVDDYAWFQDATFDVGAAGTLNFWVRMDNTARRNQFFEGPGNAGMEMQYREQTSANGQFYGRTTTVGGDFVIRAGGDKTAQGIWTNLQYTWDFATKEMHIYRDGVESGYQSGFTPTDLTWTAIANTVNGMMNVGRDPGDPIRFFDGLMDDVAWFNTVLTSTERDALRTVGVQAAQDDTAGVNASGRLNAIDGSTNRHLVAFWNLDDALGTTEVAGDGGTSIVLHTQPHTPQFVTTGKFGGALEFNGTDHFATFQDPTFDVGAKGTLSFWVAIDATTRRNQFFEGPGGASFEFQWNNGNVFARANGGGDFVIQTGGTAGTPGTWINLQYTWDFDTKEMRIYRNGTEVSYSGANNQNIAGWNSVVSTVNQLIQVGRDPGTAGRAFDGRMDDVAWFNTVLTATERSALVAQSVGDAQLLTGAGQVNATGRLNSTTAVTQGHLVAYWNFDDADDAPNGSRAAGDGGTNIWLDIAPQVEGALFVAGGGPTLPIGGPPLNAVEFDGTQDFIRTADSTSLDFDKSQGSISFWVRPDQLTVDNNAATGYVALVEDTNRQIFVGLSRQQNAGATFGNADFFGRIVFSPFENSPTANTNIIVSDTRLTVGRWTHVTVTWDYATLTAQIFIDGALDASVVNNTTNPAHWTQPAGNTGDWIFGADGATQAHGLVGRMAEIAVYGSPLKAGEVQSVYQTGAADSGSFDLAGARGRFTWDDTFVYGLIESYAAGPGTANGPFDNLELELFINDGTTLAARLDASVLVPMNNVAGSTVAPAGSDVQLYEFRIPIAAVDDGVQAFDPTAGDFLRYRLRTIDGDTAGSGFDTRDTTLGWVVEPPLTSDGLRRLDFARTENFFGVGGRLTYTNFAHLELNAGDGVDALTVVDSQIAPPATNPTRTFTLNMGAGDDVVTVAAVDTAFNAAVTIDGQADDDQVTIDAPLTLGGTLSTGNLEVTAETIALNAPIDTTAGTVGDVSLHVGTSLKIAAAADITAGGDVLVDGPGATATEGDITTLGGNITVETATTLDAAVTFDSDGGNIAFSGAAAVLDGPHNFTLDAGGPLADGDVTFDGVVGGATPLVDVVVTAARHLTINAAFDAESLAHAAGTGTTTIDGAVTLTEAAGPALVLNTPTVVVNAVVSSAVGEMQITTDVIDLDAGGQLTVLNPDGLITLVQRTDDRELELGGNTAGRLALDAAELLRIAVGTFRFGDGDSGDVDLSAAVAATNIDNFHITTGAGVAGTGSIDVFALAVEAVDDVDLSGDNDADFLGIRTFGLGSQISYRDLDDFELTDVDGVGGISTVDGDVTLEATDLITQDFFGFGSVVARGLQIIGADVLLDILNDVDVLAADVTGSFALFDFDDLLVGTVQTFGRTATTGVTTTDDPLLIAAGDTLSLEGAVDVGNETAVLVSFAGAVEDVGPATTKVFAEELLLLTEAGVGNVRPLRTEVGTLAAWNLTSGRIAIDDRSGASLEIGAVLAFAGLINDADGGISVVHTGPLAVNADVAAADGPIELTTLADGGDDDHLLVNAPVFLAGGADDITFLAGTDLLVNDAGLFNDVQSDSTGDIVGTAGRDVVIGPSVRIQSFSGAIENIPPWLQNVSGPQIAATGDASVTFDYGRLLEFNFTALVDWSDGTADLLVLGAPGTTTATHVYTGNPNLADPAAPIPIIVTLRSDARIRFTGYETTTAQILLDFPGDGVRNVRIDTTIKVRYLTAAPPERIAGEASRSVTVDQRSTVAGSGGGAQEATATAERVVILREVLPDGTEGSAVRFDQSALDDLPELFQKVRNGRYRVYLFEPATQSLRMVMEVYVRDGKPSTPDAGGSGVGDPADGASAAPAGAAPRSLAAEALRPAGEEGPAAAGDDERTAAAGVALGAGLVAAGGAANWTERVDAALAGFRKFSRLRRPSPPRRKLPR